MSKTIIEVVRYILCETVSCNETSAYITASYWNPVVKAKQYLAWLSLQLDVPWRHHLDHLIHHQRYLHHPHHLLHSHFHHQPHFGESQNLILLLLPLSSSPCLEHDWNREMDVCKLLFFHVWTTLTYLCRKELCPKCQSVYINLFQSVQTHTTATYCKILPSQELTFKLLD